MLRRHPPDVASRFPTPAHPRLIGIPAACRAPPTVMAPTLAVPMKKTISTEKLHALRKAPEGFLLIDVLGKEEFAKDHIPGARNVPLDTVDFAKVVADRAGGSKTRRVVLYGRGNACPVSAKAVRLLAAANFTHVVEYEGGLAAWNESKRARLAHASKTPG